MQLGDLVRGSPFVCGPEATLSEVAAGMTERGHGSAGVIHDRAVVGVITERDLVRAMAAGAQSDTEPAHRWMAPDPDLFESTTDVFEAAEWLLESGYRHLPVVESGRFLGVVSLRDLLRAILASLEDD